MKKTVKMLMSTVMVACLILSVPTVTNAETNKSQAVTNASQTVNKQVLFTVTVKDDKELKAFLDDLDKYNKNSKQLWEKALKGNKSQNANVSKKGYQGIGSLYSSINTCTATTSISLGGYHAHLGAYASFYVNSGSGSSTFGSIRSCFMYAQDSSTTLSNLTTNYRVIDMSRTLAVSSSMLVGVKTYDGSFEYYPLDTYVEMYASGGYWWP